MKTTFSGLKTSCKENFLNFSNSSGKVNNKLRKVDLAPMELNSAYKQYQYGSTLVLTFIYFNFLHQDRAEKHFL